MSTTSSANDTAPGAYTEQKSTAKILGLTATRLRPDDVEHESFTDAVASELVVLLKSSDNAFFLCSRATLSATSVVFRSCFEYGRPSTAKDDDAAVECITLEEPSEVIRRVLRLLSSDLDSKSIDSEDLLTVPSLRDFNVWAHVRWALKYEVQLLFRMCELWMWRPDKNYTRPSLDSAMSENPSKRHVDNFPHYGLALAVAGRCQPLFDHAFHIILRQAFLKTPWWSSTEAMDSKLRETFEYVGLAGSETLQLLSLRIRLSYTLGEMKRRGTDEAALKPLAEEVWLPFSVE